MSINWVMPSGSEAFTRLPGEQILYTSSSRTTLALQTSNKYPGKEPLSIRISAGRAYLTNQRVVYLPASETPQVAYLQASEPPQFKSLTAPILNFQDAHVSAPFFGPNVWSAKFEPVPGGGIPAHHALVELKMVFKEGGAYDFHSKFERMKERLQQAVDVARESGHMTGDGTDRGGGRGAGPMAGINMAAVDLEQLPAYEMGDPNTLYVPQNGLSQAAPGLEVSNGGQPSQPPSTGSPNETFNAPSEPPPGYEEVQRDSVAEELERRQREEQ